MTTNKVLTYTSTGQKILRHPEAIRLATNGYGSPVSLQLAVNEVCNLECAFCSVANRSLKLQYDFNALKSVLKSYHNSFPIWKTIEITGGGEPILYPWINELIAYVHDELRLEVGLITNGLGLKGRLKQETLDRLKWIRVSMSALEFMDWDKFCENIPKQESIKATLGMSYVYHDPSTPKVLEYLKGVAIDKGAAYVRIVPNCLSDTKEEQNRRNEMILPMVEALGAPLFYQTKRFDTPPRCFWGYFKPFLYPDTYIYPCSSVVLNQEAGRTFHEKYRVCKDVDFPAVIAKRMASLVDTQMCPSCVFGDQNRLIDYISTDETMRNFV